MDVLQAVYSELFEVVVQALDLDEKSPIIRDVQAARIDWRGLVDNIHKGKDHGLNLPYLVALIGKIEPDDEWSGLDFTVYRVQFEFYYIDRVEGTIKAIDQKMQAVHAALRSTQDFTHFFITEPCIIDNSDENAANKVFLEAGTPLLAGSISGYLLTDEG